MKKFLSFLMTIVMIVSLLCQFSVSASDELNYTKLSIAYTISGKKYYKATLTDEYNGVATGTTFYVDNSNNVVTDIQILKKLSIIDTFVLLNNTTDNYYLDIQRQNVADYPSISKSYYNSSYKWTTNAELTKYIGNAGLSAINIALNVYRGNLDDAIDGSIDLVFSSLESVVDAKAAVLSAGIVEAGLYADHCGTAAQKVIDATVDVYDYDSLYSFFSNFSSSWASYKVVEKLCGGIIDDIVASSDGWLSGAKVTFKQLTDTVVETAFDSLNEMFMDTGDDEVNELISDTLNIMKTIKKIEDFDFYFGADDFYKSEYDTSMEKTFFRFGELDANQIASYMKLAEDNLSYETSYAVGTYTPSTREGCNVRSGSSTAYSKVGAIAYGTHFNVAQVSGNWGYTTCNGISGWVCLDYANYVGVTITETNESQYSSYYQKNPYYAALKNVKLTGNQAEDIANIAYSQIGYHEGDLVSELGGLNASGSKNYSEAGYWFGTQVKGNTYGHYYDWCAMFISWCARQADIPTSVISNAAYASSSNSVYCFNNLIFTNRKEATPKKGDLIFFDYSGDTTTWDHVGIVYAVSDGYVTTIEGNSSNQVRKMSYPLNHTTIHGYGRPNYKNSSISNGVNSGGGDLLLSYNSGIYTPSETDGCNIRSGASTAYSVVGAIAYGTQFSVTKVSGSWGYTTCNGISGWVCLEYTNAVDSLGSGASTMDITTFNSKLDTFKKKYPNNSTYIDNPTLTGGYECFGFANELGVVMYGSYPTNSMSATVVNNGWTVTYGGGAVDNLCIGDIVRYHYHSIFITNIVGNTIYYCEALGDAGNRVQYDQSISRSTLKKYVSEVLWSGGTNKTGWVAHYKNGLSSTSNITISYFDMPIGEYKIYSGNSYLTSPTDTSTGDEGGDVIVSANNNSTTQLFDVSKNGNAYVLTSKSSINGKVVNIYRDGTASSGDNVTLYKETGDSTQLWCFEQKGSSYVIRSYNNPSLALTINGTDITVSTCTYASNQLWNLSSVDDNTRWGEWSDWSTTEPTASDTVQVESKTQYGYYHYILQYSDGNCGAYPIDAVAFNKIFPSYPTTEIAYHTKYFDSQLSKVDTLAYGGSSYNCYANSCCPDSYDYDNGSNASYFYDLGTRTVYRSRTKIPATISVTDVTLNRTSASLKVGTTETLTATVAPSNATNKAVTWMSSDSSVATVSATGIVSAKAAGIVTITVETTDGAKVATCTVTVTQPVTGVTLNNTATTLKVGTSKTLTATVAPSSASNKAVTWISSDAAVATVSTTGVVTAKSVGTAIITVKTEDGAKVATCTVTVTQPVTGVTLNKATATIDVGDTLNLTATVAPSNATNKNITWNSSNMSIASVSNGVVTAKAAGTTTITATTVDGSKTATCVVTVNETPVIAADVIYSISSASGKPGSTVEVALSVTSDVAVNGLLLDNLNYDKNTLEFVEFANYGDLITNSVTGASGVNSANGIISLGYTNAVKPNGQICIIKFRVKDTAEDGEYTISIEGAASANGQKLPSKLNSGKITVSKWTSGDFDNDENLDMNDVVYFMSWVNFSWTGKYEIDWEGEVLR